MKDINLTQLKALYKEGFPADSDAFVDFLFQMISIKKGRFVMDKDVPVSGGYLVQKTFRLWGQDLQLYYLSALATKPQYRGRGLIGGIVKELLSEAAELGSPVVFLCPFHPEFYKKFGFCDVSFFSSVQGRGGTNFTDSPFDGHYEVLEKLYAAHCEKFDQYIVKDESSFKALHGEYAADGIPIRILSENGIPFAYYIKEGNKVEKYATAEFDKLITCETLRDLKIYDYRSCESPLIQARVTDVRAALKLMRFPLSAEAEFTLKIHDPILEKNNLTVNCKIKDGVLRQTENNYSVVTWDMAEFTAFAVNGGCFGVKQNKNFFADKF